MHESAHAVAVTDTTLVDVLRRRASAEGSRTAYTFLIDGECQEETLTYAALEARARRIATVLAVRADGGSPVLLIFPPGLDFVAAFYGCLVAGAVAVPVYPPEPTHPLGGLARLDAIAADAGARVVLTTVAMHAWIRPWLDATSHLARVVWCAVDALDDDAIDTPPHLPTSGAVAFLQYTSGSTGTPKGVVVTHANLIAHGARVISRLAMSAHAVVVSWLPLYHDMGLIGTILVPMQAGCVSVQLSPLAFLERPRRWLQAISRHRGTVSPAPNFAYDLVVRRTTEDDRHGLDLRSWQAALNGAEPVRAATCDRFAHTFEPYGFRRTAFVPCYGLAEATLMVAGGPPGVPPRCAAVDGAALDRHRIVGARDDAAGARVLVGCGRVVPDVDVAIVRPGSDEPCATNEIGEIWIAGPSVADGYWRRPVDTTAMFGARLADGRGPYLRTGDLGFVRDGELFVTGRQKDLIVVRGRNHYPQDLEATAAGAHPALRPGGGIAFAADDGRAERVIVVHEVAGDHPTTLTAAIAAMRDAMVREHGLRPDAIVLIPPHALPKTSSGKVRRGACRAALAMGDLPVLRSWRADGPASPERPRLAAAAPVHDVAAWLSRTIAEIRELPPENVGLDDPLDGFGVDSAEAAQLAAELETRLGRPIPLSLVMEHPTIRSLAAAVCEGAA